MLIQASTFHCMAKPHKKCITIRGVSLIKLLGATWGMEKKYRYSEAEVLTYSSSSKNNNTVRRYYERWRKAHGINIRCDISSCKYYSQPLVWNGKPLKLILDHVSGNNKDNTPQNLRLLCPNCDSQLPTSGGGNKNRTQNQTEQGYETEHKDGTRDAKLFINGVEAKSGVDKFKGGDNGT